MHSIKPIALTALILAVPALGLADINAGDKLGNSEAEIRAAIEAQGYTVHEIEFEDGKIEVEVLKDGVETELVLVETDGTVLEVEIEDDDD